MNALFPLTLVVLLLLAALPGRAEDAENVSDALNLLLAHSDAVIVATSVKPEIGPRFGVRVVSESFKDVVTLTGEQMDETLTMQFERELRDDPTPFKPGQRLILFLRRRHATSVIWDLPILSLVASQIRKAWKLAPLRLPSPWLPDTIERLFTHLSLTTRSSKQAMVFHAPGFCFASPGSVTKLGCVAHFKT